MLALRLRVGQEGDAFVYIPLAPARSLASGAAFLIATGLHGGEAAG